MCLILTVCGRLVIQWTKAAVLADWQGPFMGLAVAALYILFSGGMCLPTALAAHTGRCHTGTLSAIADMLPRFAKPKYLPGRGGFFFLPNRHRLKASSSAPFTVAELNMTHNYLILRKKGKEKKTTKKRIPWVKPASITPCYQLHQRLFTESLALWWQIG